MSEPSRREILGCLSAAPPSGGPPEYRLRTGPLGGSVTTVSDLPERWTKATVYPDMWADPREDPRNSEGVSPDGELSTLQDYLRNYRLTLLMKCEGLDPGQLARRSVPPSN